MPVRRILGSLSKLHCEGRPFPTCSLLTTLCFSPKLLDKIATPFQLFLRIFAPFRVKKLVFTNPRSSFLIMSMRKIGVLSSALGIPQTSTFGKYLGCPIHDSRPTKQRSIYPWPGAIPWLNLGWKPSRRMFCIASFSQPQSPRK